MTETLNQAWARINAIGGYVEPGDKYGQGINDAVAEALDVIESLGGRDPAKRRHKVDGCPTCATLSDFHPPHDASPRCESGGYSHCSCDTCF